MRVDRVELARQRLTDAKARVYSGATSAPCIECRFYMFACRHPSVADVLVDPESGKVELKPQLAKTARSEMGLCGPEGELFARRSDLAVGAISFFRSGFGIAATFMGGAILLDWLLW